MVLTTIATVMLAVLYLMVAHNVYTSQATLSVAPLDPQAITSTTNNLTNQDDSDFLDTQCVVIKSNAVLALAMDRIREARTLQGVSHPMDAVQANLQAEPAKLGKVIDVSYESTSEADANLITSAVVEAYKEYESNSWKSRANVFLETLNQGSDQQKKEMAAIQQRMEEIALKNGSVPDIDPERSPQHMEVQSLRDEKRKAEVEKLRAQNAYSQAGKAIVGHPDLLKKENDAEAQGIYTTNPEEQLQKYQQELAIEQAKLVDDGRQFGPNHPTILADQSRINDMIVATVVVSHEWVDVAQSQLDAIDASLKVAEKAERELASSQNEYQQLHLDADRLKKLSDDVENRMKDIDLTKGAGALNIEVLNPAKIQDDKVKPNRTRTLLIGLVLGLMGGLGLGCVRDWTDDRMRTPGAIRSAVGAQVLGAIPAITAAYTASDRGQIVHHDPFGDASESFRTLRTALQFGLPTGTKTMLITSPVSGDGKSTFVSNLGIVMAQASMRILIIDADLRAPMQHRLFGLKDRIGLATVLGGADTLEQAIQRTEIEGLDVLPCGPAPFNPAEMLNSPAFAEKLEELADRYDLVLLDSPPITAVADARILAACADVSLLVIRLESSKRKQAEAARDGLRSVGARLIGVAVNGVARNSGFGSASGYYPHSDFPPPTFSRGGSRSAKSESVPASDTAARS